MTLLDFFQDVMVPVRSMTPTTAGQYRRTIRQLEDFADRRLELAEVTDDLLGRFVKHLVDEHWSPWSVQTKRAKLLAILRLAWKRHLIDEVPRDVPTVRKQNHQPRAWTIEQVEKILDVAMRLPCQGHERMAPLAVGVCGIPPRFFWTALILVAYETAGRISAVLRVRTEDVSLSEGYLMFRACPGKQAYDQLHWLSPECIGYVARIHDLDRLELFPWPHCREHLWTCFRKIVEAAGVPSNPKGHGRLFHCLRRTSLSYLARHDVRMAVDAAGHTSEVVTRRHYLDARIATSAKRLEALPKPALRPRLGVFRGHDG